MSVIRPRPERLSKPAPRPRPRTRGAGVPPALRAALHQRAGSCCERCGIRATNFHHRKNRSQGGLNELSNALLLCGSGTTGCHGWITEHPAEAYEMGWSVRSTDDPATRRVRLVYGWVLLDNDGGVTPAAENEQEAS